MAKIPHSAKLLPLTPYVASASFRTDIFEYGRWEGRPATDTWEEEVKTLNCGYSFLQILRKAAVAVDELELRLQSQRELWEDCGFKTGEAKPITDFKTPMLADFLVTQLLDRLIWGCSRTDLTETRLTYFRHQQLRCKPWIPRANTFASKYFMPNCSKIHAVLDRFLNTSCSTLPSYNPPGQLTSASIAEVSQLDKSPYTPAELLTHPASWTDGNALLYHASTSVMAINHLISGRAHRAMANMWVLAMSLLFIYNIHDRTYPRRLKHALMHMNLDKESCELMESFLSEEYRGRRISRLSRILPAAIALCHSPIFILDENIDLTAFEHHSQGLTLQRIVNTAFIDPPSTSDRTLASERAIWKQVCRILQSAQRFEQVMAVPVVTITPETTLMDLNAGLIADLKNAGALTNNPRETSRDEWPFRISNINELADPSTQDKSPAPENSPKGHTGGEGPSEDETRPADIPDSHDQRQLNLVKGQTLAEKKDKCLRKEVRFSSDVESESSESEGSEQIVMQNLLTDPPYRFRHNAKKSNEIDPDVTVGKNNETKKVSNSQGGKDKGKLKKRKRDDSPSVDASSDAKRAKWDGSILTWVPHIEIKYHPYEDYDGIPSESPELIRRKMAAVKGYSWIGNLEENPEKGILDEQVNYVSVIRHVLLPDGVFHRQCIQFELTWPDGCEHDRKYVYHLLSNSRPAEVHGDYKVIDEGCNLQSKGSDDILPSKHFGYCGSRKLNRSAFLNCEERIATKPCLIIPPRSMEDIEEGYDTPILKWEDVRENLHINIHVRKQIHDVRRFNSTNIYSHIIAGSLKDMIESNRRALNMLDMPNPTLLQPEFIQQLSLDVQAAALTEGMGFPATSMRWNQCATEPALTQFRYDAGKLCTWIRNLRGAKLWFVLENGLPEEGLAEFDVSKGRFVYFLLEEGSILTMPPGTPHAVLNITDCIAEGGHMFLRPALDKSLKIGLREGLLGNQDTDESQVGSEAILHAILLHYYISLTSVHPPIKECFSLIKDTDGNKISYAQMQDLVPDLPTPANLAALICMCVHAHAFEPSPVNGQRKIECLQSIYDSRTESRRRAEEILVFLEELWVPVGKWEAEIINALGKAKRHNITRELINHVGKPQRSRSQ